MLKQPIASRAEPGIVKAAQAGDRQQLSHQRWSGIRRWYSYKALTKSRCAAAFRHIGGSPAAAW